ncbi:MAG TPA: tRNA uridine-5-carboxymethylaminomethyl(34) synthesis GTPase MnmE [Bacteroidota bacterium]|nr:tRNA uridine-5-carboxymethylaminomethyl(34) synthesis GTPase MnmE [Bacteroidota bacterium]
MKILPDDTIAALATPPGEGAIAVIRLSGARALEIADRVFRGRRPLASARGFTVHHGKILALTGEEIDECLATVFRAPRSYTGEDVVEVSCHGGLLVSRGVLGALIAAGSREAAPGEFTRRAFLNGKMDLSRAEAVAALIAARTDRARRASLGQLNGRLAGEIGKLREGMKRLCSLLELDLDFAEEGLTVVTPDEIERKMEELRARLDEMSASFTRGRMYRDGISVAITGPPNAGKSSLFNALLRESRAIVTPVAGTTRDYIEESVTLGGVLFSLRDTAGLREADDPVEQAGIARAVESASEADIILIVTDARSGPEEAERTFALIPTDEHHRLIFVANKIDLAAGRAAGLGRIALGKGEYVTVSLSALTGEGVHELTGAMVNATGADGVETDESLPILSERHERILRKGARLIEGAIQSLRDGLTNEFVAIDIREALSALGEITGEVTSEDILNTIFSEFCIGK